MKILQDPHQDPQGSLRRSLKIFEDLVRFFTRELSSNTTNVSENGNQFTVTSAMQENLSVAG